LARAFKQSEADLVEMFVAVGLTVPETTNDKPVKTAIGAFVYWLNKDSRGAIWINGDEVRAPKVDEPKPVENVAPVEVAPVEVTPVVVPAVETAPVQTEIFSKDTALAGIRLLLKPNKRGSGVSAEVGYLAKTLGQELQAFLVVISELGLALPATEEHKPTFVEHADEIFWLNKNPKDGSVWVNAKTSKAGAKKSAGGDATVKPTAKPRAKKAAKAE
jgi:hypothetical protein